MNLKYYSLIGTVSAFTAAAALLVPAAAPALSAEVEADADVQILTRGPVHEAFAESVSSQPEPGLIVSVAPPEPIEELPPEQQLEGDNVTWISGYWAWDDDQNDFLWISGVWRNLPPGRQWVPGYWSALDDGRHQWTSGYWADSEATEVDYIAEAPPQTVDVGPNVEAPSEDHTWIPGNWVYGESRYVWRPGHWNPLRENWTWVPSRYCWSPRGYIYVDGYWDYAVANRGILFAPVHFRSNVYAEPSYYYTPSVVVSLSVFTDHLFYRPRSCHYYFGDYYAPRYSGLGFYASHSWHSRRGCFDPIYAHHRWNHRHDRGWDLRQRDRFDFFRNNEDARPLHNWAAMRDFRGDRFSNDDRGRTRQFANSLAGFAKNPTGGQRFRSLDKDSRQQFVTQNREVRNFSQQRRQLETRKTAAVDGSPKQTMREKLSRSPLVGRSADRFAKNDAPPKRPEARGTNVRVAPKPPAGMTRGNGAIPGNGRSGALAQRGTEGSPTDKGRAREDRKPILPGTANRGTDRGSATKDPTRGDRNPATPGIAKRSDTTKPQTRELPGRKADPVTPRPSTRELPGRRNQVTPQRPTQPKPQVRPTPQRQVQPKPQVRQTPTPQRSPQATPQRQVQPRPQVRPTPQRQTVPQRSSQPKPQVRQAPQRSPQAAPQRQVQPRPQVRQAQPRPQVRQATPQRQVQPQRQAQPRPQVRQAPQRQIQPRQQPQARPQPQQRQAPQQRGDRSRGRPDA